MNSSNHQSSSDVKDQKDENSFAIISLWLVVGGLQELITDNGILFHTFEMFHCFINLKCSQVWFPSGHMC